MNTTITTTSIKANNDDNINMLELSNNNNIRHTEIQLTDDELSYHLDKAAVLFIPGAKHDILRNRRILFDKRILKYLRIDYMQTQQFKYCKHLLTPFLTTKIVESIRCKRKDENSKRSSIRMEENIEKLQKYKANLENEKHILQNEIRHYIRINQQIKEQI